MSDDPLELRDEEADERARKALELLRTTKPFADSLPDDDEELSPEARQLIDSLPTPSSYLTAGERYEQALHDVATRATDIDLAHATLEQLVPREHLHRDIVHLYVYDNALTSLPPQIGELLDLQVLDAASNKIKELPATLTDLSQLVSLNLAENNLSKLPEDIHKLGNLRDLDISANELRELPGGIGGLDALIDLDVSANLLKSLPVQFGQLRRLEHLNAGENDLTDLGEEICRLRSLRQLSLFANDITEISPAIRRLRGLRELGLAQNKLSQLPDEIGMLRELQVLDLAQNQLTHIPASVGKLANLIELDLSDNPLEDLPKELGYLRPNILLRLDEEKLPEPLATMYLRGTPALLNYLRSLEDSAPEYEAKLLLVGEGGVGKSSLIAALRDDEFMHNRPTTHGIEINQLNLSHPNIDDVSIKLNTWDFGGQEVYRISHQFFFSKRALYLCVWKPREGHEENGIESWCRRIRLRVGDQARIIVVATHAQERRAEFDFEYLRAKFPHLVVDYFCVDSETGDGVAELRAAIARHAANLPQMGELLNNSWRAARDEVLAHDEAHITRLKFERICARHKLDEESTATLAGLMHDLGHIINYADDEGLRDIVVLRPEWLTKAIGYVLEDSFTRRNSGVLPHDHLTAVWSGETRPGYPAAYHPYFLRLMEKFDVSYRLPDQRASLVAQLVPYERPGDLWQDKASVVSGRREVVQAICRTAEEAPGLIAWLTVRNHRFSAGKHWRRGVLLEHNAYQSQALLELLPNNRDLRLTVVGPAPDYFFQVIKDGIEDLINHRWKAMPYQFLVPCRTVDSGGRRCAGFFPHRALVLFRQRRIPTVRCTTCAEESDVEALLSGLTAQTGSLENMIRSLQRQQTATRAQLNRIETSASDVRRHLAVSAAETARQLRVVLRILSTEVVDCPRLFTLAPADRNRIVKTVSTRSSFKITLWCEESGSEHPWQPATYDFRPSKEWINTVGPYVRIIGSLLRFIIPVGGAIVAAFVTEEELKKIRADIDLTKTLADKFPEIRAESSASLSKGMTRAEGAGLRALRSLLLTLDPSSSFGDLRRVHTPSGDVAWICPEHHTLYDPGLPDLS